jgi:hypothetical protein
LYEVIHFEKFLLAIEWAVFLLSGGCAAAILFHKDSYSHRKLIPQQSAAFGVPASLVQHANREQLHMVGTVECRVSCERSPAVIEIHRVPRHEIGPIVKVGAKELKEEIIPSQEQ